MQYQTLEYFDGTERLVSQLFYPKLTIKNPAILVFPAFEGLATFAVDYAQSLVKNGYAAMAVDMYGDARTADTIEGCFELIKPFLADRNLVRRRAKLAYKALAEQLAVEPQKIGAVGFCFGGMCVLELARSGENLKAGVSMHGMLSKSNLETQLIKAKLLILHGYKDIQVPPSSLAEFAEEMQQAKTQDWTFTFFSHAMHSYTDPRSGTFDPKKEEEMGRQFDPVAANRSFRYALDFFEEHLQG